MAKKRVEETKSKPCKKGFRSFAIPAQKAGEFFIKFNSDRSIEVEGEAGMRNLKKK